MLLGVQESQSKLEAVLGEFTSVLLDESKELTLEASKGLQKALITQLSEIMQGCTDPAKLSLDVSIPLSSEVSVDFPELIQSYNLDLAHEGLLVLKKKLSFQYSPASSADILTDEAPGSSSAILTDEAPFQLYKKGESLQDNRGQLFSFKQALGGRGQSGSANFYEKAQKQFLIKEDLPDTCLFEGTAYFVKQAHLLPVLLADSVNYATVATLATDDNVSQTVSVQPRVMSSDTEGSVCPWDVIVYETKRNPKTAWSFESWYPDMITRNIAALNSMPQWQLAASIQASNIAGDESLHVGQFMATLDKNRNVIGITRIDLGARERASVQRNLENQESPFHASLLYQESMLQGKQGGKDYISYLLAESGLKRKYTYLWVNMGMRYQDEDALADLIKNNSKQAFISQYNAIPKDHKETVLTQVLATINKGAKTPLQFPSEASQSEKVAFLSEKLAELDASRTLKMLKEAKTEFEKETKLFIDLAQLKIESGYLPSVLDALKIRDHYLQGKEDRNVENVLKSLDVAIKASLTTAEKNPKEKLYYEQIKIYTQAALSILDAMQLSMMDDPTKKASIEALEKHIRKYNTLLQAANYCTTTKSTDKLDDAVKLMHKAATKNENEFAKWLQENTKLIEKLGTKTLAGAVMGTVVTKRSNGFYFLQNIFRRYGLDESLLVLTREQVALQDQILKKNFKNVKNMISGSSFNVSDAVAPNIEGVTALHLLMLHADSIDAYEAIAQILLKSRGYAYNTDLLPLDRDKNTPLDFLVSNPHAQELLSYLKEKKYEIKGAVWGSKTYKLTDFFEKSKIEQVESKLADAKKMKRAL